MNVPRREGKRKPFKFGRKAERETGRKERMAVHEEAARLQQGTAFQSDGGLSKGDAYKKAAQNHDAGTMGGTHEYEHETFDGKKTKSQSTRHWGSSDYTYTTPKGQK